MTNSPRKIQTAVDDLQSQALTDVPKKIEAFDNVLKQIADLDRDFVRAGERPAEVNQPRTGKPMNAQPLDRSPTVIAPGQDAREALVAWMTDPRNDYFSGAISNRLWKHFMGVGLVEPVDDLRASNPPTNPALFKISRCRTRFAPI